MKENFNQSSKSDYSGHRKRLRERYKKVKLKGWQDYEILELLLTYVIPRKDTKPVAKRLIRSFKSLSGVLETPKEDLQEIEGVGERTALLFDLLKQSSVKYLKENLDNRDILSSPEAVYNYLRASLKGCKNEELKAIFLNSRNAPIAIEKIQEGTVNKSVVYPRKVIEQALRHKAVSVIFAHNHPGGSLKPSFDDREMTERLKSALNTVDIALLDHIIISSQGYFSFKEKKLI